MSQTAGNSVGNSPIELELFSFVQRLSHRKSRGFSRETVGKKSGKSRGSPKAQVPGASEKEYGYPLSFTPGTGLSPAK
jgi:hypothetical protein